MSNNKSELIVIKTDDGSNTIYNNNLNEHYHSTYGALNESEHVYIKHGLNLINKKHISILEIGLGTGLNAALTINDASKNQLSINYTAIEPFPVDSHILESFTQGFDLSLKTQLNLLANLSWEEPHRLNKEFVFKKHISPIQTCIFKQEFDVVYYDAFAPNKQPEMWTTAIFEKMYHALNTDGILTTYCAKGQVKRNLKEAGFKLESFPGPVGKREITVAHKN